MVPLLDNLPTPNILKTRQCILGRWIKHGTSECPLSWMEAAGIGFHPQNLAFLYGPFLFLLRLSMLGIWGCKYGGYKGPILFPQKGYKHSGILSALEFSLSWALPPPWFPAKELEFAFFWLYPLYR